MVSEELARAQRLVGRILDDKFRLRSCIGIGGSGAVYKADQIALGRTVAVKILAEELTRDPRLVKRFHDEALAASRLNHPNTVSVIDYGQTPDGLLYLVMEYLRGPTLTHLVGSQHPLPLARVCGIASQILLGLEEAHFAGVVHADVKCDNIVVDQRRTGQDQVKVVDFGIARLVNAPRDGEDRNICGTPEYMAPEVISGAPPSVASDLYAVGIVLYEMIVGQTPFVGGSAVDILTRQLKTEAPPASKARAVPPELDALLARALRKKPQDRFADAAEMRRALDAAAARLEQPAAGPGTSDVECPACGEWSSPKFRFCPECGQPRARLVQTAEVAAAPALHEPDPAAIWPPPLVGRDDALDQLAAFLTGKTTAPALLVVGDAGAGRSALLSTAYDRVADAAGITIYQADPDPTGLCGTLYPLRALVATILELPPVCARDDLEKAVRAHGLSDRDVPGLAELFGHQSELFELEAPVRRREIVASSLRLLAAETQRGPTAVTFEDVDRVDAASVEVLRRMAERAAGPVRLIVSLDEEHARTWPADCVRVRLGPLDGEDLGFIVSQLARAGLSQVPSAMQLADLTAGMPAHVEHLVRYLAEGGAVEHAPASLPDLVAARVATLPRDTLIALQAIAVFGRQATVDAARRAANLDGGLDEALAVAVRRGLIEIKDDLARFPSVLVRDVIYDATPAHVRRQLHVAAHDELASTAASPAELGHHHEAAGHRAEAATFLAQAGDIAAAQLDDAGAADLYQRALAAARAALATGDLTPAELIMTSIKLAEALRATGELALARGVLREAETWGDHGPRLTAQLLRASGQLAASESEPSMAVPHLQRAVGAAIASGDGDLIADSYLDLASLLVRVGKSKHAARELEEAIDLVTLGEGKHAARAPRQLWRVVLKLAQIAVADGDQHRAIELGEVALAQAQRARARAGAARAQSLLAACYDRIGNHLEAERHRRAAVEEMRKMGDRRGTAELLLYGTGSGRTLLKISPDALREAHELASEVGWSEGEARASSAAARE